MRVLFFEPNHSGHHLAYFSRMLPGFLELPIDIALATTESAIESSEFEICLGNYLERLEIVKIETQMPRRSPLRNARWRIRELARATESWRADHVCVLYADGFWELAALETLLPGRALPERSTLEAWIYRGGFAYPDSNRFVDKFRKWLFRRLLKCGVFEKIHLDDELAIQYVNEISEVNTEVVLPANPVAILNRRKMSDAKAALGLPPDVPIVSLSGQIAKYKGAHLALKAIEVLTKTDGEVRLLLAGPHDDATKDLLSMPPFPSLVQTGRVVSKDEWLNTEEMFCIASASDLVIAPYFNHSGRSSIILWAAAAGRPVLAVDRGCIRHVVETQGLGRTCDVLNPNEFAKAIEEMLARPWSEIDAHRVRDYAKQHSIENYQRLSAALVRKRCEEREHETR